MKISFQRKRYLVYPSLQLKYIAMGVLPALITGIFCTYFLLKTGELTLQAEKDKMLIEISSLGYTIQELMTQKYPPEIVERVKKLKNELFSLQNILRITYYDTLKEWEEVRILMLIGLLSILVIVGLICLIYSHRIAGPLVRLKKYIDMFCEGKNTPGIHLRKYDEFKDLAGALEKLRQGLEAKGILK